MLKIIKNNEEGSGQSKRSDHNTNAPPITALLNAAAQLRYLEKKAVCLKEELAHALINDLL